MNDQQLLANCKHMLYLNDIEFVNGTSPYKQHGPLVVDNRKEQEACSVGHFCDGCEREEMANWLRDTDKDLDLCVYCVLRLVKLYEEAYPNHNIDIARIVRL